MQVLGALLYYFTILKLCKISSHICMYLVAERTTEETAMNETSSRSHQILRLVFILSLNYLVIEIILLILFPNFLKMMIPADG